MSAENLDDPMAQVAEEQQQQQQQVGDIEMEEEGITEAPAAGDETALGETTDGMPFAGEVPAPPLTFMDYLASPIVTLVIGEEAQTKLSCHQALLCKSPYFKALCDAFPEDGSPRRIDLLADDPSTVSCFLEYLYTGEYFPRKLPSSRALESDPAVPEKDDEGTQLLKHARVYTLAEKFEIRSLRILAASKIHCIDSTVKGEIAFARYAYQFTKSDDTTVRAPIASFWATRSHALRAEAEEEFKKLCLEFPQFGYDVLTRVLDDKLKKERNEKMHPGTSEKGRKRARHSSGGKD